VTLEVPAVADAGVWREMAIRVDANCTDPKVPVPELPVTKAYETKA
jgi:hypothetical protein